MAKRIYCVTITKPEPATRLISANSASQAFRHVADEIITAELASQTDLIDLTKAGVTVEDAAVEPEQKKAAE